MFTILQDRKIHPIFLRLLFFIYKNQCCDVLWNTSYSYRFTVTNGVRQGAVSSPLLFSVYINDLIVQLRRSGLGCMFNHCFFGCLGYADDLLLLSASRSGLQAMVAICEKFAKARHLKFSSNIDPVKSKTKCIVFTPKKKLRVNIAPIILNHDPLPWVEEVKHLGNVLQCDNTMKRDVAIKRGKFIGKINSLLQELHFVEPEVFVRLMNIYCSSFYGSNLWDLFSNDVDRLYKSWNVTIRNVFKIPFNTHRYLIETISGSLHPKTMLTSRFVKFSESLTTSSKAEIRYLANVTKNDNRTLIGKTLARIARDVNIPKDNLTKDIVKTKLVYFPVPDLEKWRCEFIMDLLKIRRGSYNLANFTDDENTRMINFLCTS